MENDIICLDDVEKRLSKILAKNNIYDIRFAMLKRSNDDLTKQLEFQFHHAINGWYTVFRWESAHNMFNFASLENIFNICKWAYSAANHFGISKSGIKLLNIFKTCHSIDELEVRCDLICTQLKR